MRESAAQASFSQPASAAVLAISAEATAAGLVEDEMATATAEASETGGQTSPPRGSLPLCRCLSLRGLPQSPVWLQMFIM